MSTNPVTLFLGVSLLMSLPSSKMNVWRALWLYNSRARTFMLTVSPTNMVNTNATPLYTSFDNYIRFKISFIWICNVSLMFYLTQQSHSQINDRLHFFSRSEDQGKGRRGRRKGYTDKVKRSRYINSIFTLKK